MLKRRGPQPRHYIGVMSLFIIGVIGTPGVGRSAESPPSAGSRSPADFTAEVSDCIEFWSQRELTIDEESFERAFVGCLADAREKWGNFPGVFDDDFTPLAGDEGRGLQCIESKWDCHSVISCPQLGRPPRTKCVISSCGLGKCPRCPDFLGNILIKSWCAYVCKTDEKPVGGGFEFNLGFKYWGPVCFGS